MTELFILGLDVSMNKTGWAVVAFKDNEARLVDSGIIKVKTKDSYGARLRTQRNKFKDILETYPINTVAREAGFTRHTRATQVLFRAYGVAEEFFVEYDLVEYAASTIKRYIAKNGKATKEEVDAAVREILNLSADFKFASDDESDAIAIAITHAMKSGVYDDNL
jgi:crossover junction endodeoxyribonuclease RuvC